VAFPFRLENNLINMDCINKVAEIEISYCPSDIAGPKITCAKDSIKYIEPFYNKSTIALQEEFIIIYLNRDNHIIGVYRHSIGSMSSTIVDVRIILGTGLKIGSQKFIISHNHPSGNLTPSNQDIELTKKIKKAGAFMDLILLDHLIVDSKFNFYSFADCDLL